MADETKRIINQPVDTSLSAGDYVIVDSQSEGTRQFDLGSELRDIKEDLSDISGVPTNVRQAIDSLFDNIAYTDDMTEELAVVRSWAEEVTSISLSQSALSISGQGTATITATTIPVGAEITWTSSNESVATVSGGVITAVGNGSCIITASAGGKSATCAVTVSGLLTVYPVVNNLTHCSNSNSAESVSANDSYSATLTADTGYTIADVTITMNGTDVTSSVYNNGTISIPSVIGTVVITATAMIAPLKNGTHEFDVVTVEITKGNHVKVTAKETFGTEYSNPGMANITDLSLNTSVLKTNTTAVNNLPTWITLPATTVVLRAKNIVMDDDTFYNTTGGGFSINIRLAGGTTGILSSPMDIKQGDTDTNSSSTLAASKNAGCIYMYMNRMSINKSVEFDLELTVNGNNWL